jgi:hypothetical protein
VWRVFGGAALVVAGIAAFIEAHSNLPEAAEHPPPNVFCQSACGHGARGLSPTAYDLLRIGAWALVIIGALLVVVGLIGYWGAQRR